MLAYQIKKICKLRGIANPHSFLVQIGISSTVAQKFLNDDTYTLRVRHIEALCLNLNCTPNDLFYYKPSANRNLRNTIPLDALIRKEDEIDIVNQLRSLDINQMKAVSQWIDKLKENQE
ncbi:MAG: helix-turn-helix transcriptional regulator [Flavobacteriaceae bacterium]|nr:helix-turn-helix transcriptional regulator [Flavobacteriaceae bacterium]